MNRGTRARRAPIGVLLALMLTLLPASASATTQTGYVGGWEVEAFCGDRSNFGIARIDLSSSVGSRAAGAGGPGSQHRQWLAWKAALFYSTDASSWVVSQESSWRIGVVDDPINSVISNAYNWWDSATGQWGAGFPSWDLYAKGWFGIYVDIYWYADDQAPAGQILTWAPATDGVNTFYFCHHE